MRLFARLRDLAGSGELAFDVPVGSDAEAVWRALAAAHPAVAPLRASIAVALNAKYAKMAAPVAEGDEVAFLPPVSGG